MTQLFHLLPLNDGLQHSLGLDGSYAFMSTYMANESTTPHRARAKASDTVERKNGELIKRILVIRDKLNLNNRHLVNALNENGYSISYHNFQRQIQGNSSDIPLKETLEHVKLLYKKMKDENLVNDRSFENQLRVWYKKLGLDYTSPGVRSRSLKHLAEATDVNYISLWRWRKAGAIPFSALTEIDQKVEQISAVKA